jgi:Fe-S-cluster containining protein
MSLDPVRTGLSRGDRFGFGCSRCGACCRDKRIPLNPYEIARLAALLGLSTTAFIDAHTTENGAFLRFDDTGHCPFLKDMGCTVHTARPLACRLYPLGRHLDANGTETFLELRAEPECALAERGEKSVGDWLDEQAVAPYVAATDLYLDLLWKLLVSHRARGAPESPQDDPQADAAAEFWLDIDAVLASHGLPSGEGSVEDRMRRHIQLIEENLNAKE